MKLFVAAMSALNTENRPVSTSSLRDRDIDAIRLSRCAIRTRYHSRVNALPLTSGTLSVVMAPTRGADVRMAQLRASEPSDSSVSPSIRTTCEPGTGSQRRDEGQGFGHRVALAAAALRDDLEARAPRRRSGARSALR